MKKTVIILSTLVLVLVGFSLSMTAIAWSINPIEMLYLPLWVFTIIGLVLFITTKKIGIYLLLFISILWLLLLAGNVGWFLISEPGNLALWGVIGLPTIASIIIVFFGTEYVFDKQRKLKILFKGISILIPLAGTLSYADKIYHKRNFSETIERKSVLIKADSIPQGKFKYEIYFAEFGGRLANKTCEVEIKGNKITVFQDETTNLTGGKIIFEGMVLKHKSGKWILADKKEDVNAKEIGGCTETPIIDFEKKLIEWC